MEANKKNSKKYYSLIKGFRSAKTADFPSSLNTPYGTYTGKNVLEGFTADAEGLAKHDEIYFKISPA